MNHKPRFEHLLLGLLFLALALAACGPASNSPYTYSSGQTYPVDPVFREFYLALGGAENLGPAISPAKEYEHYRVQFTVAGLLVFDTQKTGTERFQLAPLGLEFGVEEPPAPVPEDPEVLYQNQHTVEGEFLEFYRRLNGQLYIGQPLTNLRYNPDKRRLEQYFENLGFYISDDDPEGRIRLMEYGLFKCDQYCRYPSNSNAYPVTRPLTTSPMMKHFGAAVSRLGTDFAGIQREGPYTAEDGMEEVIYDNLVLYLDPADPQRVYARPLTKLLGIQAFPLVERIDDPRLIFYPMDGDLGRNVAVVFVDYLAEHGGLDIAGQPTTEIFLHEDGIWRQCFTNLCLDYLTMLEDPDLRIRPAALGSAYFFRRNGQVEASFEDSQSLANLTLKVWEARPLIRSDEEQTISVGLFQDNEPLPRWEPDLTVEYPSGRVETFYFPPTDSRGMTHLNIPPVRASNGSLVYYKVCVQNLLDQASCVDDAYLIWGNP